jgi:hypothetical protein
MKSNIRQAAINAIKEGNLSQLRALKLMIDGDGYIPVYYQVLGELELYSQSGEVVEVKQPEPQISIDGILPFVSSVVVTFSGYSEMEKVFDPDSQNNELFTR